MVLLLLNHTLTTKYSVDSVHLEYYPSKSNYLLQVVEDVSFGIFAWQHRVQSHLSKYKFIVRHRYLKELWISIKVFSVFNNTSFRFDTFFLTYLRILSIQNSTGNSYLRIKWRRVVEICRQTWIQSYHKLCNWFSLAYINDFKNGNYQVESGFQTIFDHLLIVSLLLWEYLHFHHQILFVSHLWLKSSISRLSFLLRSISSSG